MLILWCLKFYNLLVDNLLLDNLLRQQEQLWSLWSSSTKSWTFSPSFFLCLKTEQKQHFSLEKQKEVLSLPVSLDAFFASLIASLIGCQTGCQTWEKNEREKADKAMNTQVLRSFHFILFSGSLFLLLQELTPFFTRPSFQRIRLCFSSLLFQSSHSEASPEHYAVVSPPFVSRCNKLI